MEVFDLHHDVIQLAGELKRRHPHLAADIEAIQQEFALDRLALEDALRQLRRLANARYAAELVVRAAEPEVYVDTRIRSYNPPSADEA